MIPIGITLPERQSEEKVPVVILLHGYLGTNDEWGFYYGAERHKQNFDSIAARLMEHGIGSIRVNMPGTGDSKDDFRNYTLTNCRSDLEDGLIHCMKKYSFDANRIGFLGWSMGAKIGATFLLKHQEIRTTIFLNPAGDNGGNSIMNASAAGLDYGGMILEALNKGEVKNELASIAFGRDLYISKTFFEEIEASKTGDEIKSYVDSGRRALMIYGDSDTSISPSTYDWLRNNTGISNLCIQNMDHDMGLESERPDFTNTVIDIVTAYFNCYL